MTIRACAQCVRAFCVREIAHDCNSCGRMSERDVSGQNDETICTDQKKAVPLHRISNFVLETIKRLFQKLAI